MRNLTTLLIGVMLAACFASNAMARDKYPPGPAYRTCPDTLTLFEIEQTDTLLAPCHPATLDTVWGAGGIVTGFDTKTPGLGFYIQNKFANGPHAWTSLDIFTGSFNYNSSLLNLVQGDSVIVYGTTQEFPASNGTTEIEGPDVNQSTNDIIIRKVSSGNALPAFHVGTTADFNWVPGISAATAEPWEGCLVKINGPLKVARVQTGLGVGTNFFLIVSPSSTGDSVLVDGNTLATFGAPPLNTPVDFVQGILNQGTSQTVNSYRIQLRGGTDIQVAAPPNLTDAYPLEDNLLRLVFDKNLDPATAQTAGNYSLGSQLAGSTVDAATMETNPGTVVRLNITSVLTDGQTETVNAVNIGSATYPTCLISPQQTREFVNGVLDIATIQAPDPAFLPIYDDRSRFSGPGTTPGKRLTVRGISVDVFGSLYYIEDLGGGTRSGISVFAPTVPLTTGHKYRITAAVQEFGGETEVTGTPGLGMDITDEGVGPTTARALYSITPNLEPVGVLNDTTTDKNQNMLTGEDFEGVLVRIQDVKCIEARDPGQSFLVVQPYPTYEDTILVSNLGSKYNYQAVQYHHLNVNGVLHYVNNPYPFRILPRGNSDIVVLGFVSVDEAAPRSVALTVAPNPARTARVTFAVPKRSEVNLAVFDLQGREVARIAKGVFEPGSYTRAWNGTDRSGRKLGSGMFFYRLKVGDRVLKARSVIIAN